MRYLAFATDYDGTLAAHGVVPEAALRTLRTLRESGRKLVLVTGRQVEDLRQVFPEHAIFDRIVAENGAVVLDPETREERLLGAAPSRAFVERLEALGVSPLSVGRVIVATWEPHDKVVLEAIRELGLELQVIFNKGAVMILPSGINKAVGLRAALADLGLSPHNALAIGDAENDHALLAECELGIAVGNALPTLAQRADLVTRGAASEGVCEVARELLVSDLASLQSSLTRHDVPIGRARDGRTIALHPYGPRVLLCGASGSGKSTLAIAFLEALIERGYQACLVDPEGDFGAVERALSLGDEEKAPTVDEVVGALQSVEQSVAASLLALPLEQRSAFLIQLLARCSELRARTGRPHWFVIDEAHHMLPEGEVKPAEPIEHAPAGLLLVTVHPQSIARRVLQQIDTVIVVGASASESLQAFAAVIGLEPPRPDTYRASGPGSALIWSPLGVEPPRSFVPDEPRHARHRHHRKYAAGTLGADKSFYFHGPRGELNLRAQNLMLFLQIGDGVDDATWLHHLRRHDYSKWVRDAIKNDELAAQLEAIERDALDAATSRKRVRGAIEKVYTLPA